MYCKLYLIYLIIFSFFTTLSFAINFSLELSRSFTAGIKRHLAKTLSKSY